MKVRIANNKNIQTMEQKDIVLYVKKLSPLGWLN